MALSDKDIIITPNRGQTDEPRIDFVAASASLGPQTISVRAYPLENGTLSFEGTAGQLFSITNSLTGVIYSVNDVSGIPSFEILDTGVVRLAPLSGNVLIGTTTDNGTDKLQVNGLVRGTGLTATPQSVTVTGATTALDLTLADHWHLVMQANTTFSLTNIDKKIGSSGTIILKQDGTGGRTFTLASEMKTPIGGAAIAQVTGANTLSILTYYVYDANTVLVNYIGNFA